MNRRLVAPLLLILALPACSGGSDSNPGATSADEDRQLNDAAAMLDANSIDLNQVVTDPAQDAAAPTNESRVP